MSARPALFPAREQALRDVHAEGLPSGSTVRLEIDRHKAQAMGVGFSAISDTLSAAMGSQYVNDFPNAGRLQQVIVQAEDGGDRREPEEQDKTGVHR